MADGFDERHHHDDNIHRIGGALLIPDNTSSSAPGAETNNGEDERASRSDHEHGRETFEELATGLASFFAPAVSPPPVVQTRNVVEPSDQLVTIGNELSLVTDTFTPTASRYVDIYASVNLRQFDTITLFAVAGYVILRVDGVDVFSVRWHNNSLPGSLDPTVTWALILDDTSHTVEVVVNSDGTSDDDVNASNCVLVVKLVGEP